MKSFKSFLTELTKQESEVLFSLTGDYSAADVKLAYKKMSMIHHPDKGGDVEVMKKVNAAWKTLKGETKGGTDAYNKAENKARWQAKAKDIAADISGKFDVQAFKDYFKQHLGHDFNAIVKVMDGVGDYAPSHAGIQVRFETADGKIAFDFDALAYLFGRQEKGGLSNSETISYTIQVTAFGYANRKKQKMAQRDWDQKNDHILLSDPKKSFPLAKMKKIASGVSGKMTRADFKLAIEKELKGENWNTDTYLIPVKDGFLRIFRTVIMRTPFWSLNDLGVRRGSYAFDTEYRHIHSLAESEETLDILLSFRKKTMKQVDTIITKMKNDARGSIK